jgi:hypothetical protein
VTFIALIAFIACTAFIAETVRCADTILPEETGPEALTVFVVAGLADLLLVSDFFVTAMVVSLV